MKSKGQRLYEYWHPAKIKVVHFVGRHFAAAGDAFLVDNPANPPPWYSLTQDFRDSLERTAHGHNLFSEEVV